MSLRLKASYLSFVLLAVASSAIAGAGSVVACAALTVSKHALAALVAILSGLVGACGVAACFPAKVIIYVYLSFVI